MIAYIIKALNYLRNKLSFQVILIILIIIISFYIYFPPNVKHQPQSSAQPVFDFSKKYLDENKRLHTQINQMGISAQQQETALDSLSKLLKVKSSQIKTVDHFIYNTDTVFRNKTEIVKVGQDTMFYITHKDGWLEAEAGLGKDSGYIHIQHKDTLTRIEIEKRSLFKPVIYLVDISNKSPYSTIVSGYSFKISRRDPDLVIGPYAGYDPFTHHFSFGISIQKPILKIFLKK